MHATSFARWPVTDTEIDPGSDMPKPLDQWSAIKASRHQSEALDCSPLYARNPVGRWIAVLLKPVSRRAAA